MPRGYLDTQFIDFPANIDAEYLRNMQNRSGMSFASVLSAIDARLAALNQSVDPLVASLIYPTEDVWVDDAGAAAFEIEEATEYAVARPQYNEAAAHALPLKKYDVALGFTEDGLDAMSERDVLRQIDGVLLGYRALDRKAAMRRLFTNTEVPVQQGNIRTTMKSPGFAGAPATGDNAFTMPYPDGTALPASYSFYAATTEGTDMANVDDVVRDAAAEFEKWHGTGGLEIIPSVVAANRIKGSALFTPAAQALIQNSVTQEYALVDPERYIGVYDGTILVRKPINDFADTYTDNTAYNYHFAIVKSYGAFDPRNPLAMRLDPLYGRDAVVRFRSNYPLDNAFVIKRFGIGVGNRVGAYLVNVKNTGSTYSNPTI